MGLTRVARAAAVALSLLLVPACSTVSGYKIAAAPGPLPPPHIKFSPVALTARWMNGVALSSMSELSSWESATGEHPAVITMFARFGARLPIEGIRQALSAGAIPLLQLDPSGTSLGSIIRGAYDRELHDYESEIRALDDPVFLSFGHEMNGTWYSWGCGQTSPASFRAAWRYIHAAITAPNVTWVWTINDIWQGDPCPIAPWYPGSAYVDWVGIDGYLRPPVDTFSSAFGRTLTALHHLAHGKPVLLAESGVSWGPAWTARLKDLYGGAYRAGLRGIVYFDGVTSNGDYRPQTHPYALAEFRKALRRWS